MREERTADIPLMKLDFITEPVTRIHGSEDIELLYVLRGAVDIKVEESLWSLQKDDMLVINVDKKRGSAGSGEVLLARLRISYAAVSQLLGQGMLHFSCNSTVEKNEAFGEIRTVLHQILNQYLRRDTGNQIYLFSLHYRLLHLLTANFLLTGKDIRKSDEKGQIYERTEEILHYIRSHYHHSITLQDLSDQLFLSTSYLSKFIKKHMNKNFLELVTQVRLNHAVEDLTQTDLSVLNVAMQNGFASLTAFNKSFKEVYHQTPSEYRKQSEGQTSPSGPDNAPADAVIAESVLSYFKDEDPAVAGEAAHCALSFSVSALDRGEPLTKNGNRMINIGTASDLLHSVFREHLLQLKNELGFQYVRFWDLYGKDMLLDIHAPKDRLHFGRLDEALDFLLENRLKPYMELGFKPLRLLKTTSSAVREVDAENRFRSHEEMEKFYREMMKHLVRRYGAEEVESWYFELWKREKIHFVELSFTYSPLSVQQNLSYFDEFDAVARGIRSVLPGAKIGGGGFSVQHYGHRTIDLLLRTWQTREHRPDFISLNCYPYVLEKEGDLYFEKRSTDMFFVRHTADAVRQAMQRAGLHDAELHVSEYNLSLSNRNTVHDSCQKGAFLLQTLLSNTGGADILGYWVGSDLYADYRDTQHFLFGGCGLLTKTGIPKPAFYAFRFFQNLCRDRMLADKNIMVTKNGSGVWRIAAHNFKNFGYHYYLSDEHEIKPQELPFMPEDREPLQLSLKIEQVEDGLYTLKHQQVHTECGSVQNELESLQLSSDIGPEEQAYLNRICVPRLSGQTQEAADGTLAFTVTLLPNEIRLIHIEKSV